MERPVTGVDLDHALAKLLPAALAWHNADQSASVRVDSLNRCMQVWWLGCLN